MKGRRPGASDAKTDWEIAGWSREPRNGREWRQMKEGLPEPQEQALKKVKPCRKCGNTDGDEFTIRKGWNKYKGVVRRKLYRCCLVCKRARDRGAYARRRDQARVWNKTKAERLKNKPLDPPDDGSLRVVPLSMMDKRFSEIGSRVTNGQSFVFTYFDEPVAVLVSMEDFQKLKKGVSGITYP